MIRAFRHGSHSHGRQRAAAHGIPRPAPVGRQLLVAGTKRSVVPDHHLSADQTDRYQIAAAP
jgi:hypothetical protein